MRGLRIFVSALVIGLSAVNASRRHSQQIDAPGTEFDHNQLHDELQFSGGELPSLLRGAFGLLVVKRDVIRHHQCHSQWLLPQ